MQINRARGLSDGEDERTRETHSNPAIYKVSVGMNGSGRSTADRCAAQRRGDANDRTTDLRELGTLYTSLTLPDCETRVSKPNLSRDRFEYENSEKKKSEEGLSV